MKRKIFLCLIILISSFVIKAQTNISGYVYDKETNEVLINATIYDSTNLTGTVTNTQGYFIYNTNSKKLRILYNGYKSTTIFLSPKKDTIINIYLEKATCLLNKVQILADKENSMNISGLDIRDIVDIPALGGQVDVIKATQILPGIQTQSEASSMLIVRGGDPGQNMFLLDNVPLTYVNHLGGFMSVFNPDIINDITIYKGGFPAMYGGKLSSIISITQRNGNSSDFKGSFGIGLTDANICLEGKLADNLTCITTARKTLIDPIIYLASLYSSTYVTDGNTSTMSYGFHDINVKLTWEANKKNKFTFNIFQGDDYINSNSLKKDDNPLTNNMKNKNTWGNYLTSLSWNCLASPKVFGRTVFAYTRYRIKDYSLSEEENEANNFENTFNSSINEITLNSIWQTSVIRSWNIDAGFHFSYINSIPYSMKVYGTYNDYTKTSANIFNNSLSLNNNIILNKRIDIDLGLRLNDYYSEKYNEILLEPRLDANFDLKKYGRLNINYMHASQGSHLLVTAGNIKTNQVWLPSTTNIPVSKSKQISLMWKKYFYDYMFDINVGVYYKNMSDLITAKESFYDLKDLENWENTIEKNGIGEAYGLEFMIKKNYGKWTGLLSYHLSKSTRQFDNINNGEEYLYEYNRTHDFSIFIKRQINKKWSFSIAWYYQTGLPYTPVLGRQMILNPINNNYYEAFIYGAQNSAKMKDYHRLDIGFKYSTLSKKRNLRTVWSFSLYNAYNRKNPSYYYFNNNDSPEIYHPSSSFDEFKKLNLYQISIFPIIPSISYKVYFGKKDFRKTTLKKWLNHEIGDK